MSKKNITSDKSQNIVIRKFDVCNHCYSVSLTDPNCICTLNVHNKHKPQILA